MTNSIEVKLNGNTIGYLTNAELRMETKDLTNKKYALVATAYASFEIKSVKDFYAPPISVSVEIKPLVEYEVEGDRIISSTELAKADSITKEAFEKELTDYAILVYKSEKYKESHVHVKKEITALNKKFASE